MSAASFGLVCMDLPTPGDYTFECSMPGHAAAGMRGTIKVH